MFITKHGGNAAHIGYFLFVSSLILTPPMGLHENPFLKEGLEHQQ